MSNDPIREGREWVWPDGTRLPVVSGGSDVTTEPTEATPDAPAPTEGEGATPADGAVPAADAPPEADKYAHWPEDARAERERLLEENIKYRQRWKPYEETFSSLHDDDAKFFLGFIDAIRGGDQAEVARYAPAVRQVLDKLSPAEQAAAVKEIEQAAEGAQADDFDPFNREHVEKLTEERIKRALEERDKADAERRAAEEQQREVAKATEQIQSAAKVASDEHGIPEWGDPTSDLYAWLVSVAHRRFQGETTLEARMAKAAEHCRAELDRRGQELLKAKTAGAGSQPAPQGGEQPSGQKVPTTLDEATESALRRLEGLQRGPG